MATVSIDAVTLHNADNYNVIVGQAHFIKTVEDIYEAVMNSVPGAQFGLAFCEASGPRLIRTTGTDGEMEREATRMAEAIGAGHAFVLVLKNCYPINVLPRLKEVPEVVTVFAATANPLEVLVAATKQGRGIVGVIDGGTPLGVEELAQKEERKHLLRTFGYKQ